MSYLQNLFNLKERREEADRKEMEVQRKKIEAEEREAQRKEEEEETVIELGKRRADQVEKERLRVKVVTPIDVFAMHNIKRKLIPRVVYCKQKEYLYDFARHYNSRSIKQMLHGRDTIPWMDLYKLIYSTVEKEDEGKLYDAIQCLIYCNENIDQRQRFYSIDSPNVIQILYDFCESVMNDIRISSIVKFDQN